MDAMKRESRSQKNRPIRGCLPKFLHLKCRNSAARSQGLRGALVAGSYSDGVGERPAA